MILIFLREFIYYLFPFSWSDPVEPRFRDVGDGFATEISAVSCTPINPSRNFTNYIVASFWGSNCVKLFSPESNLTVICESPNLLALPRSLLLHNFGQSSNTKDPDYHPHLLAGLTDGTVVSYAFKNKELVDQSIFSLGDLPVLLNACQVDSRKTVFACGSRASILFWEKDTLRHSPVILKVCWNMEYDWMDYFDALWRCCVQNIAAASRLNTSSFSSCLVLATPNGLLIGNVSDIDKLHIRSVSVKMEDVCQC